MNARALSKTCRAIRPSVRCLVSRTPMQRRFASSEQRPSQISQFYKTFTRPVAKVLLVAFFTYQLAYWAWVKLELDEIMAEREAHIAELEDQIARMTRPEPTAEDMTRINDSKQSNIHNYQLQLMELEQRNREVRAKMLQAENEGMKGQETTIQKKTSPWWKVW